MSFKAYFVFNSKDQQPDFLKRFKTLDFGLKFRNRFLHHFTVVLARTLLLQKKNGFCFNYIVHVHLSVTNSNGNIKSSCGREI